uniref:Ig-like domain-containing protein n=1 Tax=Sphaeramia orbicularis TaxID=375764 RepID=A0A673BB62_9TELE
VCSWVEWLNSKTLGVTGFVGHNVTLPCSYDSQTHGVLMLSMCWGRGSIPNRGCAGEIIKTNGKSVTSSSSERYQLMGNLREGDVSLTIRQVEEGDSGTYGCRVDIPGWFNDHKHEITLTVVPGLIIYSIISKMTSEHDHMKKAKELSCFLFYQVSWL